ncbi:MAG TPA: phosphotransferase, partial [Blastocatellia bacterium]|nr:phosphotransferase [Blastocatellia bacterium]
PRSLEDLDDLNRGLTYGFSQVGKFITVYTRTGEEAVSLAASLHRMTKGLPGPAVPFDRAFRPDSLVHYRYGAFTYFEAEQADGTRTAVVRNDKGEWVPDSRAPGAAVPDWVSDPFPKPRAQRRNQSPTGGPLSTTFRAYEAIAQRGKGGVYRALDLSVSPARLCVLKEGRKDGETDWDGKDGHWRIRNEAAVLSELSKAGVPVPQVYASFESEGNFYLVMELVEGRCLDSLLRRKSRLPLRQALDYGGKLARLLASIHSAGWVWRDCKPANLMCDRSGDLRPLDFEGACRITQPELLPWGTPGYIPSGWIRGYVSGSVLSEDLFALGTALHYVVTGRPPDDNQPAPPIERLRRRVPEAVREVVAALLSPEPQARPEASFVAKVLDAASLTLR